MTGLDAERLAEILRRLDEIVQRSQDLLARYVKGDPNVASWFRHLYLNWFDMAEGLVAEVRPAALSSLQTARHRDLVNGLVPDDRLYSEVASEVRSVSAHLQSIRKSCIADSRESVEDKGQAMQEFVSDTGRSYQYEVSNHLGSPGAYGEVFKGTDESGRHVAVKVVRFRTAATLQREKDLQMAEREVIIGSRGLGSAPGSHLMPILDVAHQDDRLLLVMPLAERSLADVLTGMGHMDEMLVIDLVKQVAMGMLELADAGVIHRDIKPANILQLDGRWLLADFGISRLMDAATGTLTFAGGGTLEYRAPELFRDEPARITSDLYALGCVALEALTGAPAFPGPDHRNMHLTYTPKVPDGVNPLLEKLILDLLSKSRGGRPPDARRVLEILGARKSLTPTQHTLQRIGADDARRRARWDAEYSAGLVDKERQTEGMRAFEVLWREVGDAAREAVADAEATRADDFYVLNVGRFHLLIEIFISQMALGLLAMAELTVRQGDTGPGEILGNLVCVWSGERAEWRIVRFQRQSEGAFRTTQVGEVVGRFPPLWPAIANDPSDVTATYELASADNVLGVLSDAFSAVEHEISNGR